VYLFRGRGAIGPIHSSGRSRTLKVSTENLFLADSKGWQGRASM
jgi:hypothetical protein